MKAELVFDGCTFCFEVLFHVKDEEAAIHSPRLQEVLSLLSFPSLVLLIFCRKIIVGWAIQFSKRPIPFNLVSF